jgi:hypothetical protein
MKRSHTAKSRKLTQLKEDARKAGWNITPLEKVTGDDEACCN